MQYLFNENGKDIEIPLERWAWGVVNKDGTELKQFDETGRFHQVGEIDQDNIEMAVLYKPEEPEKRIDLPWKPGMRLIHKYRNVVFNFLGAEAEQRKAKVYIFGYKKGNDYAYLFILPDDRIIFTPDETIDVTNFGI